MKQKSFIAAIGLIASANISLLWNLTSADILRVAAGAVVITMFEVSVMFWVGYLAMCWIDWRTAERNRILQAEAKRRRRRNFRDIDLRGEEDIWIEVQLDEAI